MFRYIVNKSVWNQWYIYKQWSLAAVIQKC